MIRPLESSASRKGAAGLCKAFKTIPLSVALLLFAVGVHMCAISAAYAGGAIKPPSPAENLAAKPPETNGNLTGHGGPVKAIAVNRSGARALTGSFDYAMMLWDLTGAAPRQMARFDAHEGAINAVAFVPGDRFALAAGDDGSVWMWDLKTGKLHHRFKGHGAKINHLSVSDDGRFAVSASWDRTARLWDLRALTSGPVLNGHKGPVNAAVFSADSARVFTASYDGTIGVWDRISGAYQRPVIKTGWGVNVLVRLPGGAPSGARGEGDEQQTGDRLLWGALNGAAGIVDGRSGKIIAKLPSHDRPILAAAMIARPGLIATGSGDGVIRVLRIGDWAMIEEYQNALGPVWALDFLPGGKKLYYGGLDDFATLWQVAPRKAFEPVAGKYPRRFQLSKELAPGERQFARKCSVCHSLKKNGRNRAGPSLYRIFGRRVGTLPDYPYSPALQKLDFVWSAQTIGQLFALGPDEFTPGSKMPLQKITDRAKRADLISYLKRASRDEKVHKSLNEEAE